MIIFAVFHLDNFMIILAVFFYYFQVGIYILYISYNNTCHAKSHIQLYHQIPPTTMEFMYYTKKTAGLCLLKLLDDYTRDKDSFLIFINIALHSTITKNMIEDKRLR